MKTIQHFAEPWVTLMLFTVVLMSPLALNRIRSFEKNKLPFLHQQLGNRSSPSDAVPAAYLAIGRLPGGEHQACSAGTRPHEMKRRCRQPSTKRTQGPQKPAQRQSKAPVKQVVSLPSSAAVLAESREEMPCTGPAPVATGTRRCSARDAQAPGAREHSPDPGTTGKTHASSTAETQERHVSLSFPFHDARTGNTTRSNPKKRKENVLFLANTERCHKTLPQIHWPAPSHAQHGFRAADLQTAHKFG